jgi:hypothetical protein
LVVGSGKRMHEAVGMVVVVFIDLQRLGNEMFRVDIDVINNMI